MEPDGEEGESGTRGRLSEAVRRRREEAEHRHPHAYPPIDGGGGGGVPTIRVFPPSAGDDGDEEGRRLVCLVFVIRNLSDKAYII